MAKSYSVGELAKAVSGNVNGRDDVMITGVNTLEQSGPGDVTFITDRKYAGQWKSSKAAAVIINKKYSDVIKGTDDRPLIIVDDVDIAMIHFLESFSPPPPLPEIGIHESAVVDPSAKVGQQVRIAPQVTIGGNCEIGNGVVLHSGVRIYSDVKIGDGTVIHSNVVIREQCMIGRVVILHQGVSIGADGFGYRPDPSGAGLLKVPQIGNVIIEDGVEIGANSCVDRAKFGSTIIGMGTKIDNLCQIGHNCRIGRCAVIVGCAALAGSVTIGDGAQIGGGVGISDHVTIGSGARIGALSLIIEDVPPGVTWMGIPANQAFSTLRQWSCVRKLPTFMKELTERLEMKAERSVSP